MKKIYGFAALCAAMTLASCSNENEPNVPNVGGETVARYVSIDIKSAGGVDGTRAYDAGLSDGSESVVGKSSVILFDKDDKLVSVNEFAPDFNAQSTTPSVPNVSHISYNSRVEVTDKTGDEKATQMMVVLNMTPDDINAAATGETIATISDRLEGLKNNNNFIMSNSNYGAGTTTVAVTTYKDANDAPATPTQVYVERLAARVDYKFAGTMSQNDNMKISIDGAEATSPIAMDVVGIKLFNEATNTFLVKALQSTQPQGLAAWIDTDAKRSHWADCSARGTKSLSFGTNGNFNGLMSDFTKNTDYAHKYVAENTQQDNVSTMVVGVQLNGGTTFYRSVMTGEYYSEGEILKAYLDALAEDGIWKKVADNKYETLKTTDLEIVASKVLAANDNAQKENVKTNTGYDGYVQVKAKDGEGNDIVLATRSKDTTTGKYTYSALSTANANKQILETTYSKSSKTLYKYRVYKWNNGYCYYTAIFNPTDQGLAGIVRNHIYQMSFNGLSGLGTPVFNPGEDIIIETPDDVIPDDPSTKCFIDCDINILSWVIYTQELILGE